MITFDKFLLEARSRPESMDVIRTRKEFFFKLKTLRRIYDKAEIYFHQDLDGVTTAIAMRELLKQAGFNVVDATFIQYGDVEFAVKKPHEGIMPVLVDFAHGKPIFEIHTDHHDTQAGVEDTKVRYFPQARSNVETISGILSPEDIFNPSDIDIIKAVDSADYAKYNIKPKDVMEFIYKPSKELLKNEDDFMSESETNRFKLGLVANKLLLTYKNQKGFLSYLVMNAQPSLMSIYSHIKIFAKKNPGKYAGGKRYVQGFATPDMMEKHRDEYIQRRKNEIFFLSEYGIIYQFGGGNMFLQGSYDRYIPFELYPNSNFLVTGWEMGLVQASCNPFTKVRALKGVNLGETKDKVLDKFKDELSNIKVNLYTIKKVAEKQANSKKFENSVGFTSKDLYALFDEKKITRTRGIGPNDSKEFRKIINNSLDKGIKELNLTEQEILSSTKTTLYDIIIKSSGGHKCITNISGFEYITDDKEREKWLKRIQNNIMYILACNISKRQIPETEFKDLLKYNKPGKKPTPETRVFNTDAERAGMDPYNNYGEYAKYDIYGNENL